MTSNVDYSNWLSVDPNPSMKQTGGKSGVVVQSVSPSSSGLQNSRPAATSSDSGMARLDAAYRFYLEGDYENALQAFESVVASYPNNFSACRALVFVERCLDKLGRSSEVLTELNDVSAAQAGTWVNTFAKARRTYQYLQRGMYQEALAQAVQTAGSTSDTSLVKFVLYDAGSINWYDLGNKESGEEYYRQLITRFPGDPLSVSGLATLGEATAPSALQQQADTVTEEKQFVLGNYPNPFNPTTTIKLEVPSSGFASLKVYDVLGREVATLVNGIQSVGVHSATFDGSGLSSGVYFCRLTASGLAQVKKMLLTK
ncbi:MAG: T9SS type A sorting domain-containing protein [Bacteroidetes bacterium]|nr:T9SS type A sorting domain-containing protein [Bacteroidota bacterium]